MKFISIVGLLAFLMSSSFAVESKGDFSCLKGSDNTFGIRDELGAYISDPFYNIIFSSKENGKYLLLETATPHAVWIDGTTQLLRKKGDHYVSRDGKLKLLPLCSSNEVSLEFDGVGESYVIGKLK